MSLVSQSIPEFRPIYKEKSEIIDDARRQVISYYLPSLIKMREWHLLFSINMDGVSMQTFYHNLKHRDNTLILIQDEHDHIFGAFCNEEWHMRNHFYGTGECFVFSFEKDDLDITVYHYTGANEKF